LQNSRSGGAGGAVLAAALSWTVGFANDNDCHSYDWVRKLFS